MVPQMLQSDMWGYELEKLTWKFFLGSHVATQLLLAK